MKTFKQHLKEQEDIESSMSEFLILSDVANDINLTEALFDKADLKKKIISAADKTGLHIKKEKGLIGHLISAGKGIAQLFLAAIRNDRDSMKTIIKSIKKEDVIDFLLKLDQATIHIVTGPIHFIDAVTGWELWANVNQAATLSIQSLKKAADNIRKAVSIITDIKQKKQLFGYIKGIQRILGV